VSSAAADIDEYVFPFVTHLTSLLLVLAPPPFPGILLLPFSNVKCSPPVFSSSPLQFLEIFDLAIPVEAAAWVHVRV
jgi:hypothetical protein